MFAPRSWPWGCVITLAVQRIRRVNGNTWVLLLAAAVWLAVNVRWLIVYRRRQVLDIDEAGYLGMAYNDYYAAVRDGLDGWLRTVGWPTVQAPFTPAATSVQFFVTGTNVITAFAVPLLTGLATVLLTYGLAHRLGGRRLAWPALVLVATAPRLIVEARAYHFAAPAAAMTTAALYCLVRSERLAKTGWVIGFGVFVGLMPLTRTMTIAFIPPLLLAAIVSASIGPDRRGRLVRLVAAVLVAGGVAATWLIGSGALVWRYLTEFGYGRAAGEFGEQGGLLNPGSWWAHIQKFIAEQHLPHALLLFVGLCAALYVTVRRARSDGFAGFLRLAATSPVLPVALLAAAGFAAFVSSRNDGSGFTLPLVPALAVLTVWGLNRAVPRPRRAMPVTVAVIALIAAVPAADLRAPTAREWRAQLPGLGFVTITDGRGSVQSYAGEGMSSDAPEPISAEVAQQWIAVNDWGAQQIIDADALGGVTAFGLRDRLFNVNTVQLAMLRKKGYGVQVTEIKPTEVGNTAADYRRWLTEHPRSLSGDASAACLLFTATGTVNEFEPAVDPPAMTWAAERSGFSAVTSHPLPNGRVLTLWRRSHPSC